MKLIIIIKIKYQLNHNPFQIVHKLNINFIKISIKIVYLNIKCLDFLALVKASVVYNHRVLEDFLHLALYNISDCNY